MSPKPLSPPDAARRRFSILHGIVMAAFAGAMIAEGTFGPGAPPVLRWGLVLLPPALLALSAWLFVRMVRDDDEMMRLLYLRAISISAGLVVLAATLWGMIEAMMDMPGFPAFLLGPAWAVLYGITLSILSRQQ